MGKVIALGSLGAASLFLCLSPLSASCAHQAAFTAVDTAALPKPGDEEARVLLQETVIRYEEGKDGPETVVEERQRLQVLTPEGRGWAYVQVPYRLSFSEVEAFGVRVQRSDGSERVYDRDDCADVPSFPGFVLYADSRALQLDPGANPGDIVETFVRTRSRRADLFAEGFSLTTVVPVLAQTHTVDAPASWSLGILQRKLGKDIAPTAVKSERDGRQLWVWTTAAQQAVPTYTRDVSLLDRLERVYVHLLAYEHDGARKTAPDTDQALSKLYDEMSVGTSEPSPDIEAIAQEVTAGVNDKKEQAARLYAWTRDNIRYCAVAIELGGWVPHPAKDTERFRYGDCKDKANLLQSLLAVKGIKSRAVAIYADDRPRAFSVPSLGTNFNHQILSVDFDDGSVIVDPTTRTVPFAALPSQDEGRYALPSSETGSALVLVPRSPPDQNTLSTTFTADVRPGLALQGSLALTANGHLADELRDLLLYLPPGRHGEVLSSWLDFDGVLNDVKVDNAAPPVWATPLSVQGHGVERGRMSSGLSLLRAHALLPARLPIVNEKEPHAVQLVAPRRYRDTARLRLAGKGVSGLPKPVVLDRPFARYELRAVVEDDTLVVERTLEWRAFSVPAEQHRDVREFLTIAHRAEAAAIAVRPTPPLSPAEPPPAPPESTPPAPASDAVSQRSAP